MSTITLSALWSRAGTSVRHLGAFRHIGGFRRSQRSLLRLDDNMLRDIGLTRAEAEAEAARPFWDAPEHWRG